MNYLSLFSGAGGGDLACQHLLGWRCCGYVEVDDSCQRVLRKRLIQVGDGLLEEAPIYGDIRAFIDEGCAEHYAGVAEVLVAGFPCQPFSVAGQRRGEDDERNQWPATLECIRIIQPQFALLENVPGLLAGSHGYFGRILGDLAESGYDARWRVLSAADVGAPHLRKRLWVVAHATGGVWRALGDHRPVPPAGGCDEAAMKFPAPSVMDAAGFCGSPDVGRTGPNSGRTLLGRVFELDGLGPHSGTGPREMAPTPVARDWKVGGNRSLAHRCGPRLNPDWVSWLMGWPAGWEDIDPVPMRTLDKWRKATEDGTWWNDEPRGVPRVATGIPRRVPRLKALGNGIVPACLATAWRLLTDEARA